MGDDHGSEEDVGCCSIKGGNDGYLQNAQVLAVDAYKEFRTTGIKDFTQKYVGLLSHHSQTAVLSLKQLAIKQAQQARKRGKVKRCGLIGSIQKKMLHLFLCCLQMVCLSMGDPHNFT